MNRFDIVLKHATISSEAERPACHFCSYPFWHDIAHGPMMMLLNTLTHHQRPLATNPAKQTPRSRAGVQASTHWSSSHHTSSPHCTPGAKNHSQSKRCLARSLCPPSTAHGHTQHPQQRKISTERVSDQHSTARAQYLTKQRASL